MHYPKVTFVDRYIPRVISFVAWWNNFGHQQPYDWNVLHDRFYLHPSSIHVSSVALQTLGASSMCPARSHDCAIGLLHFRIASLYTFSVFQDNWHCSDWDIIVLKKSVIIIFVILISSSILLETRDFFVVKLSIFFPHANSDENWEKWIFFKIGWRMHRVAVLWRDIVSFR